MTCSIEVGLPYACIGGKLIYSFNYRYGCVLLYVAGSRRCRVSHESEHFSTLCGCVTDRPIIPPDQIADGIRVGQDPKEKVLFFHGHRW